MVNWDNLKSDPKREEIYTPDGEAHKQAKELSETSVSQLRNLLTAMEAVSKRIKDDASTRSEVQRLYPTLANMVSKKGSGKKNEPITRKFYEFFTKELGEIRTKKGFEEFLEFYKAIVQFHAFERALEERENLQHREEGGYPQQRR